MTFDKQILTTAFAKNMIENECVDRLTIVLNLTAFQ